MSDDSPTVAVLGTGIMGAAIARTLLRRGLDVRAWNRTGAKAEPLAQQGAIDPGDRVVAYITGEGLKTLDCARGTFEAWQIEPSLESFEQAAERVVAMA